MSDKHGDLTQSAQSYISDPRNDNVLIYVNGDFVPRDQAAISVFDSGFVAGDGVWEGLRLVNGKLIALEQHLDRLFYGASFIALDIGLSHAELADRIRLTLEHNHMHDGVHIRLMVTRGMKSTPNQDPRYALGSPTLVIIPEYKTLDPKRQTTGMSLFTSSFRTSSADCFDFRINSHSRLNLIQALIQATAAGADEALMLDPNGFVASCNSTNFFIVRNGALWTSSGRYNFDGITHRTVIMLAKKAGVALHIDDFTLADVYDADEAFVTGTLGGITPVSRIDGRAMRASIPGPVTKKMYELYHYYLAQA